MQHVQRLINVGLVISTADPDDLRARGKQYIVVAIGASDHPAEYVALALP